MKKTKLLNSEISYIVSKMGHLDELTIADAGLPIPLETKRIDLAVTKNIPTLVTVLESVISELCIQEIIITKESSYLNAVFHNNITKICKNNKIKLTYISHELFKKRTKKSKAVVRTGEFAPYANVILISGVVF